MTISHFVGFWSPYDYSHWLAKFYVGTKSRGWDVHNLGDGHLAIRFLINGSPTGDTPWQIISTDDFHKLMVDEHDKMELLKNQKLGL